MLAGRCFTYAVLALSTCLLQAQSGAAAPAKDSVTPPLSYQELRARLHRQPPLTAAGPAVQARRAEGGAARRAPRPHAAGAPEPSFAGFYAAQVLPGLAPVGAFSSGGLTYNSLRVAFLTADFNHDGHGDLLTIDDSGQMALALGDGKGHFATPVITVPPAGLGGAIGAFAADINGDGYPDVIVTTKQSTLAVFTDQKNGTFVLTSTLTLPNAPVPSLLTPVIFENIATGSGVTGHSNAVDIVVEYGVGPTAPPNPLSPTPAVNTTLYRLVFFNDGQGNFSNAAQSAASTTVPSPYRLNAGFLTVADVNGDGKVDIIAPGVNSMTAQVVDVGLGNGDGTFAPPAANPVISLPAQPFPYGDPPVVLVESLGGNATQRTLLIGGWDHLYAAKANGDGSFQALTEPTLPGAGVFTAINWLELADVNGDGTPDLLVSVAYGSLASYLGRGDGTFAPATGSVVTNLTGLALLPALGDFDEDGKLDFIAPSEFSADVAFGKGRGDGTFAATPLLARGGPASVHSQLFTVLAAGA